MATMGLVGHNQWAWQKTVKTKRKRTKGEEVKGPTTLEQEFPPGGSPTRKTENGKKQKKEGKGKVPHQKGLQTR